MQLHVRQLRNIHLDPAEHPSASPRDRIRHVPQHVLRGDLARHRRHRVRDALRNRRLVRPGPDRQRVISGVLRIRKVARRVLVPVLIQRILDVPAGLRGQLLQVVPILVREAERHRAHAVDRHQVPLRQLHHLLQRLASSPCRARRR